MSALSRARRGVGLGGSPEWRRPAGRRRFSGAALTLAVLVAPSVFLILVTHGYPLVYAVVQALHNGTLVDEGDFVGLQNFVEDLTNPIFWQAARFTAIFTVVGVLGSWVIGLGLALLLRTRLYIRSTFRTLLLLPWVVPIIVSSTAWNWLVATPSSPIPELFNHFGLGTPLFLADARLAQITVCVFKVWVSFPFMMLMTSAALASVDESIYEAARVDGAGRVSMFRNLTLPLIARSTFISWILMTIFCINDFPTVYLLTGGGPVTATNTLVVLAYQTVFANFQTGRGIAIAFMMTLVSLLVSVVLFRQIKRAATMQ